MMRWILIFTLIFSSPFGFAQDLPSDYQQWLNGHESQEFQRALLKLNEWVELFLEDFAAGEEDLSAIPEELRGLLEGGPNFDIMERRSLVLYGSEEQGQIGLLETAHELGISDFNKLILIGALLYRELPQAREGIQIWLSQMEALHQERLSQDQSRPGYQVVDGAFTALTILIGVRTLALVGRSRWVQGRLSRLRSSVRGTGLMLRTPNLPMALPTGFTAQVRNFLQTRQGILALHGGAAALGGVYGGVQSYLYSLQTQRVSPGQSLNLIQADLACELAHGAVEIRQEAASIKRLESWEELKEWSLLLQESFQLNSQLQSVFPQLTNLWVSDQHDWSEIQENLESQLNSEQVQLNCSQISSEMIQQDLSQALDKVRSDLRQALLEFDSLGSAELIENHRALLEMHASWLITQDDLLVLHPWLLNLLQEILNGAQP